MHLKDFSSVVEGPITAPSFTALLLSESFELFGSELAPSGRASEKKLSGSWNSVPMADMVGPVSFSLGEQVCLKDHTDREMCD